MREDTTEAPSTKPRDPQGHGSLKPGSPASVQPPEEVPHYNETVVNRAFRWSGFAALGLLLVAFAVYLVVSRKPQARERNITALSSPVTMTEPEVQLPAVQFADITRESGLAFTHVNGAYGEKLLPETMGGGAAFLDFDGDGHQDLLFVNSTYWPGHQPGGQPAPTHKLYRNDGRGHFVDVTAGSGLDVSFYGMGVAIGDYDDDGLDDVFISGVHENHLFHNEGGGKFKDVTESGGLPRTSQDWSTSCAFLDYDNDGRLDLFVCNYVRWSPEIDTEVGYKLVGIGRAYGQPLNFAGSFSLLYHNEGGGKFKDVSAETGIQVKNPSTGVPSGKALGVAPVDIDGDGWIDLVVANDGVPNFVFHNQKDGTFKEVGAVSGIAFDNFGRTRGAMGIDAARYRDDGALGIVIGNFATEMTALYVAQPQPLLFTDETITEGLGAPGLQLLKFGVFFFDYDLDGRLDVLTANGHLEEEIGKIQHGQEYRQPAQLFWNAGPRPGATCYVPAEEKDCGKALLQPIVGRGSAFADTDNDGDLDVLLLQTGGAPLLLRNDQALGNNWVRLKLTGTKSNRDAIGAWIRLQAGGQTLWRQVMPTRSYLSQSELPVTIGLGSADAVEEMEIIWPSGVKQKVQNLPLKKTIEVTEEAR